MGRLSRALFALTAIATTLINHATSYQLVISDLDATRQVCSGMWGSGGTRDPWIEVVFSSGSRGNVALVIYEWQDAKYLGIDTDGTGIGANEWEDNRVYVCTLTANQANLCPTTSLGKFIVSMPTGVSVDSTSIFTTTVSFSSPIDKSAPLGIPGPFVYNVTRTGYYCVGAVPVTVAETEGGEAKGAVTYQGVVDFENVFVGHLPAAEYPKIRFYFILGFVYIFLGMAWAYLCWRHWDEILPIQKYVGGTVAWVVVEMFAIYGYYSYHNQTGNATLSRGILFIVAVLNAGRNSLSFFLLCITCMGYGVVRPSLGNLMLKVKILASVHFIFGVLYSVGTVSIPLEDAGLFLLFFVFPLAFSLTAFMMWTMWSLNATIADLEARKQSFKKQKETNKVYVRLRRILLVAVIIIGAFFVISSISFSNRLDDDYAPETWQTRFFLLDGWLGLLYLSVFASIAYIWRPTSNNRRLAMSDELATDEADAEDFEIGALNRARSGIQEGREGDKSDDEDDENVHVMRDHVVFDIGEDDEDESKKANAPDKGASPPPSYAS